MSATNRGKKRQDADFYPTAAWVVDRLLDDVPLVGARWLECAAGDGAIIRAVNARMRGIRWSACEIRPECRDVLWSLIRPQAPVIGSFLDLDPDDLPLPISGGRPYDVCLSNPPYSLAAEFVEQALRWARVVAFPLRLNFLGAAKRVESGFWARVGVPDVYVLPNRPDFSGEGGDACEYGWFVWHADRVQVAGQFRHLKLTPKAIRAEQKPEAPRSKS